MLVAFRHLAVATVVATALVGGATFLALSRLQYRPPVAPGPPDHGLPYDVARFTAADARRAFAAEGVVLSPRARSSAGVTLGNRGDVLEVDVFGSRARVERSGFYDYTRQDGRYVHFPRACSPRARDAERWHGNVRVIVSCTAAASGAPAWLRRVDRALARL